MAEIVAIRGGLLPQQASPEPDAEVVEYLKGILELAESGDLQGLVMIGIHAGDRFSSEKIGACVSGSVVGELELMKIRIAVETFGDDDD